MREQTVTEWAQAWKETTIYRLANEADCAGPDSDNSAGAKFLDHVRDALIEAVEYQDAADVDPDDLTDTIGEVADGAPDVYTHTLWAEFVDLAAYNEDPTDLGADGSDMGQAARVCLYIIAERLTNVMVNDLRERAENEDEDEDEAAEVDA